MMSSTSVSLIESEVTPSVQYSRIGPIHWRGVDRRGQVEQGEKIARGVDRLLHLLLGNVEADVQAEPQGDDRGAGGARRGIICG